MGSSESKVATVSTPKPDPQLRIKNQRLAELADPRSPTTGIDRTPIQVSCMYSVLTQFTFFQIGSDGIHSLYGWVEDVSEPTGWHGKHMHRSRSLTPPVKQGTCCICCEMFHWGVTVTVIHLFLQTGAVSKAPAEPTASAVSTDPRSPTHGISRTPLKDSMSGKTFVTFHCLDVRFSWLLQAAAVYLIAKQKNFLNKTKDFYIVEML